jgi:hypothetical protein
MKLFRNFAPLLSLCAFLLTGSGRVQAQAIPNWVTPIGDQDFNYNLSLAPASGGGWMAAGGTAKKYAGASYWLARLDSNGIPLWQKFFDTTEGNAFFSAIARTRQGYIIGGQGVDDYFDGWHDNDSLPEDAALVVIDSDGGIQWARCYGGSRDDELSSVVQTRDGGYVFVGTTNSSDGDIHDFKGDTNTNPADVWIERVDSNGAVLWEKTFGGSDQDLGIGLTELTDGSLAVVANTNSRDGDISHSIGGYDMWVLHLDSMGKLLWEKSFGTSGSDETIGVLPAPSGRMIVVGHIAYSDTENAAWVTKLASDGSIIWQNNLPEWAGYTPWSMAAASNGGILVAGQVSVSANAYENWVSLIDSNGHTRWRNLINFQGPSGIFFKSPVMNALYSDSNGGFAVAGSGGYDAFYVEGFVARYPELQDEAVSETSMPIDKVEAFPMPATSTVRISVPISFAMRHFSLYNAIGVSMLGFDVVAGSTGVSLDVSALPRGAYYIESISSAGVIYSPVLLQ